MNAQGPILSVVLTSYNQLNQLKFTLLSFRDQMPDIDHEIIVVDCGSTDGSDQFLTAQAQSEAMVSHGVLITVLKSDHQSRTAARNQGAHVARGRYLMFLDPGMIMGPGWWVALVRTLERDPQVGAVAGKIILPDGRIDHAGLALLEWWDQPGGDHAPVSYGNRLTGRSILAGKPAETARSNQPLCVQALAGEALMVRAPAFFGVGGFSARMGREHIQQKKDFSGDLAGVDLCLRLGSRGWDCVYRHESVMTRLRVPAGTAPDQVQDLVKEQDIFNKTWLGRVRGDFRVMAEGGAVPVETGRIHRYIEPMMAFGEPVALVPGKLARGNSSVVVVTGDDLETTRRCTLSLLAHTENGHELVFVDKNSSDGTREFLDEMAHMHSSVRVIVAPRETGFATAYNLGLAAARGRNVVLLNARAVVTPGWLEMLTATADFNPRAGLVGPVTNGLAGIQQLSHVDYDTVGLRGLNSYAAQLSGRHGGLADKTMRLGGFCLLIKRELLARIGGLDERFDQGSYEENDYCLRAQLAGYHAVVARGCLVHWDSAVELTQQQIQYLERLRGQWEIFKSKWGVPAETDLGASLDMSSLLAGGYQAQRHFQPLPQTETGTLNVPASQTQTAHA